MNKTAAALDDLVSSFVTLIPTWLSMLKSTRVLAALGTVALVYVTWKYGGLTSDQLLIANGIEAVTGISFMGFKTLRPSQTTDSLPKADSVAAAQPAAAPLVVAAAPQLTGVYSPADIDAVVSQVNTELKADKVVVNCQTVAGRFIRKANSYDLSTVPPTNRIEEARRWLHKAAELARNAFTEFVGIEAPKSLGEIGSYYDYIGKIRDRFTTLYGCNKKPVDENIRYQVRQIMEVYAKQAALEQLAQKTIDWSIVESQYLTPWGITEQGI